MNTRDNLKQKALLLLLLLATGAAKAQTIDSIPHLYMGVPVVQPDGLIELEDGNLLSITVLAEIINNNFGAGSHCLHKVSAHDGIVLDTMHIPSEYELIPFIYIGKNPSGADNILLKICNDREAQRSIMEIARFDDRLRFDSTSMVSVILDTIIVNGFSDITIDERGDIAFGYYDWLNQDSYMVRYGCDGTLKTRRKYGYDEMTILVNKPHNGLKVVSDSPLRYACWGEYLMLDGNIVLEEKMNFYILDSLFNIEKSFSIPSVIPSGGNPLGPSFPTIGFVGSDPFAQAYNGDYYFACTYSRTPAAGVFVMRIDKDFNIVGTKEFKSELSQIINSVEYSGSSAAIGIAPSRDGHLYFAYSMNPYYEGRIAVVKMDMDLNVVWHRYCLDPNERWWYKMVVLEDNSVAIVGNNVYDNSIFFLTVNDDYDALDEQGITVRPYAYWPNPAKDALHLHYSPDVKPSQIELYDLQGRMVRSQRNALESLNLQGLAPGTYTMRVALEDGTVFTDKVVKE